MPRCVSIPFLGFVAAAALACADDSADVIDESALALNADDQVLHASTATRTGTRWVVHPDSTAASGASIHLPDAGVALVPAPLSSPVNYVELTFDAAANKDYHVWIRGKADANNGNNDSVYLQFTDSLNASGASAYRIGTTSAMTINVRDCASGTLSNWGWMDNGSYTACDTLGTHVRFAAGGTHRIRIQPREDGLAIDQIVISGSTYLTRAPGGEANSQVILPANPGAGTTALTVMTWNVSGGSGTDGNYDANRQAAKIAAADPDVVCLNEANSGLRTALVARLNTLTGQTWDSEASQTNVVLTPHQIVSTASFSYSSAAYRCQSRSIRQVTIDVGGREVNVFCTHLDTNFSSCTSVTSAIRVVAVGQLKTFAAGFDEPRIVLGDMNSAYNSAEMAAMSATTGGAYVNSWNQGHDGGLVTAYDDNRAGYNTRTRKTGIDHLFHSSGSGLSVISGSVPDYRDMTRPVANVKVFLDPKRRCPSYATGDYAFPEDCFVRPADHQAKIISFEL